MIYYVYFAHGSRNLDKYTTFFLFLQKNLQTILKMLRIYCKNTDSYCEVQEGSTLLDIVPLFDFDKPYDIIGAKVNNVAEGLKFRVFNNRDIEFLDYRSYIGRSIYSRSLCFLMSKALSDVCPGASVEMHRPLSKGFYCTLHLPDGVVTDTGLVESIKRRMGEIVAEDIQFRRHEVQTAEAIDMFRKLGREDKVKLLETCGDVYVTYYSLEKEVDFFYAALVPSTGYLKVWDLALYGDGMILRLPDRHHPEQLAPFHPQPKTFNALQEMIQWNHIMGLETVGDVNKACLSGKASDLIQIAEALQEKKIVKIAEEIDRRYRLEKDPVRLVLITGPTSSGKSTFCKRLSVQLMACGLKPISFSTDDYFVNRLDTPRLPDGSFDFDNFDTVDHDYLQSDVMKLLEGQCVDVPEYNFVTGLREYNGKKLKIEKDTILLIEGIHALNPLLTDMVPEHAKFRIFINTITSVSLDAHNCIPTSDNRLLRRIVRDYNKGAFTARQTISAWPNVRRSETMWIYPYQEIADVLFNSAYLIEFAVMRTHAEAILATVPKNCPEYSEAKRLLKFLHFFVPVSDKELPATSLIRSFIG